MDEYVPWSLEKHTEHFGIVSARYFSYLEGIHFDSLAVYCDHVFTGRLIRMYGLVIHVTAMLGY
jgi:hypothetical protein